MDGLERLSLGDVDRDGAVQETLAAVGGASRAEFLRAALVGGGGIAAALVLPAAGAAGTSGDVDILNYALSLEYLQADFYTEAERIAAFTGAAAEASRVLGSVERAHVQALRGVLGAAAIPKASFNFAGTTEDEQAFLKTAVAFEDLGVAAYKGQAARVEGRDVLAAAVAIHSVEARHAAWMRYLFGLAPAAAPFDEGRTKTEILAVVDSTGFVTGRPSTTATSEPQFTG